LFPYGFREQVPRIRRQMTDGRRQNIAFCHPSSVICCLEVGFPIRRFPDQSLFAAPRDLSQRTTSFIASQRQGIHRMPFRHLIALVIRKRRTEDTRQRKAPLSSVIRHPLSDSKRPVLLQTHPGALAVKREPTTDQTTRERTTRGRMRTLPPRPRSFAGSPNAFPLHDVRYRGQGRTTEDRCPQRPPAPLFSRRSRLRAGRIRPRANPQILKLIKQHRNRVGESE
jgi:hypothetical protein